MNKSKIVKDALKFRYRRSKDALFWLRDENIVPIAQLALSVIDKYNEPDLPPNVEMLKRNYSGSTLRKLIFCVKSQNSPQESYIVKVFQLRCLKHKLKYHRMKYHRFGFGEAVNLLVANQRGLNVPKVYGYGRISGPYWLVKTSIVIVEYLAQKSSIREMLKSCGRDRDKCAQILDRTLTIFIDLYKAKCNHIDLNLGSIMLGHEDSKQRGYIVDFEYAGFYDKYSLEILMFQAAYYTKQWTGFVSEKTINDWLSSLLDAIEVKDGVFRDKMTERFGYYFSADLSRRERMRIR